MHMKKMLLLSSVLLTLSIITIIIFNNLDNKENNIISNVEKDTEVINSNMITMMYETEAGTGIYEETKDTTWPESGYIFNENLSGCENGGELEYNSINKTVNLLSNKSDNCYVYFDKYDGVWIDNVSVTNVTGSSVTLDISATSENGNITTYYYSLNDSEEYQETTSNPITINDLNKLTEYKISIYAIDSTNARSNIYEVIVNTIDESGPIINSVSVSDITNSGFTLTVDATSDVDIVRYYYIIESENRAGTSTSNSYTFNELTGSTIYNISVFVIDNNDNKSKNYDISVETGSLLLLTDYIKSLYSQDGVNDLYLHDGLGVYGDLEALDNSYRYSGANPNNYVCFGSDEETCPADNLYRIIGVFGNEVKLIKNTSIGNYYWGGDSSNRSNIWSNSTLNTNILNGTYLVGFLSSWLDLIEPHNWKVGGGSYIYLENASAKTVYDYEVGSNSTSDVFSAKIGLMYISDYGYSVDSSYWNSQLVGYNNDQLKNNNWLYLGSAEWTISRSSNYTNVAFFISGNGAINDNYIYTNSLAIRPVFYLNSNVSYVSGGGTELNPYRIN